MTTTAPADPFLRALWDALPGGQFPLWVPHEHQKPPGGDYLVWILQAGRGAGKSRAGAEWVKEQAKRTPGARGALVARTFGDVRDTMVEGESGLAALVPPSELRGGSLSTAWNRSLAEFYFANGTKLKGFSSEKPDQLRGPQHHFAWCDEVASWLDAHQAHDADNTTWSNLMLGLRLGSDPRCVVSTTPKPVALLRGTREKPGILKLPGTVVTRASTYANLANLAPQFRDRILAQYEGTRLGRQELEAELLEDVEGALWTYAALDASRVTEAPELARVVVAVDPAVTSGEDADETGIIVAGLGIDGHGYVLADRSCRLSPDAWARRVCGAADEYAADRIVAEVNNGGDLVERVVRTVDPRASYRAVHASRGKRTRAEPVAALYEQQRVHHVGSFPELEDQLCSWTPESAASPDRLDSAVWAISELMLGKRPARMRFRE